MYTVCSSGDRAWHPSHSPLPNGLVLLFNGLALGPSFFWGVGGWGGVDSLPSLRDPVHVPGRVSFWLQATVGCARSLPVLHLEGMLPGLFASAPHRLASGPRTFSTWHSQQT